MPDLISDLSANLSLPYLAPAQAQKHVTHNEALALLDALVQLAVASRSAAAPPADPAAGTRYLLPGAASGAWAGQAEGRLALWDGGTWRFLDPAPGWRALVLDEGRALFWDGAAWQEMPLPAQGQTALLGVNAAPDAGNRFAVSSPATLLSHEGAGHQLKINKAAAGETASLLFQTGWSGRAELGCAGADDFVLKVSEDGASWVTALSVAAASGMAHLPQGARVDGALTGTAVVGTVAQVAGGSSGALLEQGSGATGAYLRLADGTQICWHGLTSSASGATGWSFPASFAAPPMVQASCTAGSAHLVSAGAVAAASAEISAWDLTGARAAVSCALLALGRWV
ncbi:DUF2793 domain-containing protein [Alloyangia pacifica]|uniref:Uncharacterized protein n=1 Tax=Alloyangia pacifica TaxID=311180 RepID=A0A1I6RK80_9RHOB|nr:DUF2793 domain-containing protein [Alloyangia pacifica]SDI70177.1 Protein of unknown function [Alloyangia pacifica]SFS65183.1 Protein of unknown function [Alloyangia pacifica]